MNPEKLQHRAIPVATLLGGVSLALFIDSSFVTYVLLAATAALCGYVGWLAYTNKLEAHRSIHQITCAFFAWVAFSSVFAARAFQLYSLPVVVLLGAVLTTALAFMWPAHIQPRELGWRVLAIFGFEWFLILLFAPANYLVLGALFMTTFISTALLLDSHSRESVSRREVITHIVVTVLIAMLFIVGFKWTL